MKGLNTMTKYESVSNSKLFAMLRNEQWSKLGKLARLQVLQEFENRAAAEQGRSALRVVPFNPKGRFANILGFYAYGNEKVGRYLFLNRNFLNKDPGKVLMYSPGQAVATLLHEGRHAYQHAVADGKISDPDDNLRKIWGMNFGCYQSPKNTPESDMLYVHQEVEADARRFAMNQLEKIYDQFRSAGYPEDSGIAAALREIKNREYMYQEMGKKFLSVDKLNRVDELMRARYNTTHPFERVDKQTAFGGIRELLDGNDWVFDENANEIAADARIGMAESLEDLVDLLLGDDDELDGSVEKLDDLKEMFRKGSVNDILF